MAEAPVSTPIVEQADVELPQEEVLRRTSVLQDSLIEALKLRPECVNSALGRLVKGPGYVNVVFDGGGKRYAIRSHFKDREQRFAITGAEGHISIVDDNIEGKHHVRFSFTEGAESFENTPRAFDSAETFLAPILPEKA